MAIVSRLESGVLYVEADGDCSSHEFRKRVKSAIDRASIGTKLLMDLCKARWSPSPNELVDLAAVIASNRPHLDPRVAIVVSSELQFGLSRMLGAYLDRFSMHLRVFRNQDAALEYLRPSEKAPEGSAK